jgi:hypothetical protein
MDILTALAKVNVFDIEPNRQSATKRLLKKFRVGDYVWFVEDEGIRFAHSFSHYSQSLTKASSQVMGYAPFQREHGFDIHSANGPTILYSSLLISKHAVERWNERARMSFPQHEKFHDMNELLATRGLNEEMSVSKNSPSLDYFFPFGDGAFIGEIIMSARDVYFASTSSAKKSAGLTNYHFDKASRKWCGEFVPQAANKVIKTYIGWDELKRGGTFNSIDWYRSQFEWQQLPQEWANKMKEMGI